MGNPVSNTRRSVDRRSFMKSGLLAGCAATVGAGSLANATSAGAQDGGLDAGDVAILRFLAAAELIEADLWTQYAEPPGPAFAHGPRTGPSARSLLGSFIKGFHY
jgi:hypothetical protein